MGGTDFSFIIPTLNEERNLDLSLRVSSLGRYVVTHDSVLWTSPRRLREWSYSGYVLKYCKFLFEYYFLDGVNEYYDDLEQPD